ncbi:hypothetical protein [Burkholderia anthina]|uniref:hypothetical protein n=1 Tax=Burkholderia anthina TaxID=179879 RepID=UPI00158A0C04|nr:hypothetical protein [Burkholderia anthina]
MRNGIAAALALDSRRRALPDDTTEFTETRFGPWMPSVSLNHPPLESATFTIASFTVPSPLMMPSTASTSAF